MCMHVCACVRVNACVSFCPSKRPDLSLVFVVRPADNSSAFPSIPTFESGCMALSKTHNKIPHQESHRNKHSLRRRWKIRSNAAAHVYNIEISCCSSWVWDCFYSCSNFNAVCFDCSQPHLFTHINPLASHLEKSQLRRR